MRMWRLQAGGPKRKEATVQVKSGQVGRPNVLFDPSLIARLWSILLPTRAPIAAEHRRRRRF